ncbi:MAG TPA: hypothetical protein VFC78_01750 [Tepidisphaeraceae bacterium]|nr:hypothetical protein [Tepidisphaeraceae bacterium]
MSHQYTTCTAYFPAAPLDVPDTAALAHAQARIEARLELFREIFVDPIRLIPVARLAGIGYSDFADDFRLIFCALEICADEGIDRAFIFYPMTEALRQAGYGEVWPLDTLRKFAVSRYFSPCAVRARCRKILELDRRERVARDELRAAHHHQAQARAALRGEYEPPVMRFPARRAVSA